MNPKTLIAAVLMMSLLAGCMRKIESPQTSIAAVPNTQPANQENQTENPVCCSENPDDIDCCAESATTGNRVSRIDSCQYTLPDVWLTDQDGNQVRSSELFSHEGPVVVQFFFTSCSTLCPVLTGSLSGMQEELGQTLKDTLCVSISIDPNHDSPDELLQFSQQFSAKTDWRFVTGSESSIRQIQLAFDAWQQNKMQHQPLTFIRGNSRSNWTRLNGLIGGQQLATEFVATLKNSQQVDPD